MKTGETICIHGENPMWCKTCRDGADSNYPNIGIETEVNIIERDGKYWVNFYIHISGPDNCFLQKSPIFSSKKEATEYMLKHYETAMVHIWREVSK